MRSVVVVVLGVACLALADLRVVEQSLGNQDDTYDDDHGYQGCLDPRRARQLADEPKRREGDRCHSPNGTPACCTIGCVADCESGAVVDPLGRGLV